MAEISSTSTFTKSESLLRDFGALLRALRSREDTFYSWSCHTLLNDQFIRFGTWTQTLGANLEPQSEASLDNRLNKANGGQATAGQVTGYLDDLSKVLTDLTACALREKPKRVYEADYPNRGGFFRRAYERIVKRTGKASSESDTDFGALYYRCVDIVTNLYGLADAINQANI